MHSHNGPTSGRAAEIGSALAAVLTFGPRPYNRFRGQPITPKKLDANLKDVMGLAPIRSQKIQCEPKRCDGINAGFPFGFFSKTQAQKCQNSSPFLEKLKVISFSKNLQNSIFRKIQVSINFYTFPSL